MNRRETERLVAAIREARATGAQAAIAMVIRVHGSAYRREGTRMLVQEGGEQVCSLSGGCLEPDVVERARHVLATGEPSTVRYDLAEDSLFGLSIGCSGAVDIRIERVEDEAVFDQWLAVLERGEPALLITVLGGASPARMSDRMLVRQNGDTVGTLGDPVLNAAAARCGLRRLGKVFAGSGSEFVGATEIFVEASVPTPQLVIYGAGHDAVPLANLAWATGVDVTVVDVRESFLTEERFPHASVVLAQTGDFAGKAPLSSQTFVVVMNHHLERDRDSLRCALTAGAAYIGMLGPRSRYEKLLAQFHDEGFRPSPATLARVRSPVGLSLGAETPDEVAMSILGEILAVQRGFSGGFLNGRTASLHRPEASRALAAS